MNRRSFIMAVGGMAAAPVAAALPVPAAATRGVGDRFTFRRWVPYGAGSITCIDTVIRKHIDPKTGNVYFKVDL